MAFPAELGKLKSLRRLSLMSCGLCAVPAFVGERESLGLRDLYHNDDQVFATLDILVKGCPGLREVKSSKPQTPESRGQLGGFMRKLFAGNPTAKVSFKE